MVDYGMGKSGNEGVYSCLLVVEGCLLPITTKLGKELFLGISPTELLRVKPGWGCLTWVDLALSSSHCLGRDVSYPGHAIRYPGHGMHRAVGLCPAERYLVVEDAKVTTQQIGLTIYYPGDICTLIHKHVVCFIYIYSRL